MLARHALALALLALASAPASAQLKRSPRPLGRELLALDLRNAPRGTQDGDQLRVSLADGRMALFTVLARPGTEGYVISGSGARRLGIETIAGQRVALSRRVVLEGLTPAQARQRGELAEVLEGPAKAQLLVLAPHGGSVELGSDVIARQLVADKRLAGRCRLYMALGYARRGGFDRWHITSTMMSTRSYPLLARVAAGRPYARCVAIHGHKGDEILVGGAAPEAEKRAFARALSGLGARTKIVSKLGYMAGLSPRNIVNRWSDCGLQLELPKSLRTQRAAAVARALADWAAAAPRR